MQLVVYTNVWLKSKYISSLMLYSKGFYGKYRNMHSGGVAI